MPELDDLAEECHDTAREHGFWDDDYNLTREIGNRAHVTSALKKIALIHSELGELTEAFRSTIENSSPHIPELSHIEEETADVLIRVFDLASYFGMRLDKAVAMKMEYNKSRPRMHGKKA